MENLSFMQACSKFFGKREGQTPMEFAAEVRKLTDQDRADLKPGLEKALEAKIV
jgi:hypothetical protein